MSEDGIDIDTMAEIVKEMRADADEIEKSLKELTKDGEKTEFAPEENKQIRTIRGRFLGLLHRIGYPITNFFSRVGSKASGVTKSLWSQFSQLIQKCTTILSQYVNQLKLDSVAVTLGVPPSITVTLKP
jgi:hypothetical protein